MAQRRMFSLSIVDTDRFLEMPSSAQALYFHLGMRADDEGFVSSPKKVTTLAGCATDDFKLLIAKGYVIPFESGVCIITDWKQNNYIQKDRFKSSVYISEKSLLSTDENGSYVACIQDGYISDTQVRLGKYRLVKERGGEANPPTAKKHKILKSLSFGEFQLVRLMQEQFDTLTEKHGKDSTEKAIRRLDQHMKSTGQKYKCHYATLLQWLDDGLRSSKDSKNTVNPPKRNRFCNFTPSNTDYTEWEKKERAYLAQKLEKEETIK